MRRPPPTYADPTARGASHFTKETAWHTSFSHAFKDPERRALGSFARLEGSREPVRPMLRGSLN